MARGGSPHEGMTVWRTSLPLLFVRIRDSLQHFAGSTGETNR